MQRARRGGNNARNFTRPVTKEIVIISDGDYDCDADDEDSPRGTPEQKHSPDSIVISDDSCPEEPIQDTVKTARGGVSSSAHGGAQERRPRLCVLRAYSKALMLQAHERETRRTSTNRFTLKAPSVPCSIYLRRMQYVELPEPTSNLPRTSFSTAKPLDTCAYVEYKTRNYAVDDWVLFSPSAVQRGPHGEELERTFTVKRYWTGHIMEIMPRDGAYPREPRELYMGHKDDWHSFGFYEQTYIRKRCYVKYFPTPKGAEFDHWVEQDDHFFYRFEYNDQDYTDLCDTKPRDITQPPRILDLFCGCGGLSYGFEQAGFPVTWGVEINPNIMRTYSKNHPNTIPILGDANSLLKALEKLVETTHNGTSLSDQQKESDSEDQDPCLITHVRDWRFLKPPEVEFLVSWTSSSQHFESWLPQSKVPADKISEFLRSRYSNFSRKVAENAMEGQEIQFSSAEDSTLPCIPLPGEVTILIGGPPCQGISRRNKTRSYDMHDKNNAQAGVFLEYARLLRPEVVLFENVPGIFDHDAALLRAIMSTLLALGYQIRVALLNACSFGVPQTRWRTFLWAARSGTKLPEFPIGTYRLLDYKGWAHCHSQVPKRFRKFIKFPNPRNLQAPLTVYDAVSDLPETVTGHGQARYAHYYLSPYQAMMRMGTDTTVTLHIAKPDVTKDPPPPLDLPLSLDGNLPDGYLPHVSPRLLNGRASHITWGQPFWTITGDYSTMLHPRGRRTFSVRECARAQGFPDQWYFFGSMTLMYQQIGNAIPVPLARALAEMLQKSTPSPPPSQYLPVTPQQENS
ncbi:Chromo domain/shadow [Pelomyxa schiedti]|nr:Chromo domain/shadow [Pelomyxa schiedti]